MRRPSEGLLQPKARPSGHKTRPAWRVPPERSAAGGRPRRRAWRRTKCSRPAAPRPESGWDLPRGVDPHSVGQGAEGPGHPEGMCSASENRRQAVPRLAHNTLHHPGLTYRCLALNEQDPGGPPKSSSSAQLATSVSCALPTNSPTR
jgi:hypothetical protein